MRVSRAMMTLGLLALVMPVRAAVRPDPGTPDLLRRMAGVWDATLQIASAGDDPPVVINGTEIAVLGGDGAWLSSDFRSQLEGKPFQGHGVLTVDPRTGIFRRLWADATSPAFWSSEGTYDGATDSLTMWIETTDSAGAPVRWREVVNWKDDDTRIFTMYVPGPETREAAGMAIVYRRRKEPGGGRTGPGPAVSPAPGSEHAVVARHAGAWKAKIGRRGDAQRRMVTVKAAETNVLCCGGLFLVTDLSGGRRGRSFAGHGLLGYDPERKKFIRAWIDTDDRTLSLAEGEHDTDDGSLTFWGSPWAGEVGTVTPREVLEWKGSDERVLRRFVSEPGGQESPVLSIKYRRVKD